MGTTLVLITVHYYWVSVDITRVYIEESKFWPLQILPDTKKAKDGTWVEAERIFGNLGMEYRNVVLYVQNPEQKKQWEDCIRAVADKRYKPRVVVPCQ